MLLAGTGLILIQLIIGATMRHEHAGLAIPDFPTAYGKIWPATDPESVALYNQRRIEVTAANPITAGQIILQMAHRLVAVAILGLAATSTTLGALINGTRAFAKPLTPKSRACRVSPSISSTYSSPCHS